MFIYNRNTRVMAPPPLVPPSPPPSPTTADTSGGTDARASAAEWNELPTFARPNQPRADAAISAVMLAEDMATETSRAAHATTESAAAVADADGPLRNPNAPVNSAIDPRAIVGADAEGFGSHLMCGVMNAYGHGRTSIPMPLAADSMQLMASMILSYTIRTVGLTRIDVMHAASTLREALAKIHDQTYGIGAPPLRLPCMLEQRVPAAAGRAR